MKTVGEVYGLDANEAKDHPLVSVVIVNFNGGWLLSEAVSSVLKTNIPIEVIIVDNGSQDDSIACLRGVVGKNPQVRFIENGYNLGFARANNIALRQARGDYVLLLNPDCIIRPNTLSSLIESMMTYPKVGMVGCLIRNPDGTEQAGCRRRVPTPWRSLIRVLHLNKILPHHPKFRGFVLAHEPLPTHPILIEAISGAFMLVRKEGLQQVGLLDENYFLHCEDLDWCMRFQQAGWGILFVPSVEIVHYKGTCSKYQPIRVLWHKHKGMVYFYQKFFRQQYSLLFMSLVISTVWGRFCVLAGLTLLEQLVVECKKKPAVARSSGISSHRVPLERVDPPSDIVTKQAHSR
ncbi:family 2 glycosyl transferase [Candidatus Nitrosoglobus terrae]|uniref:Family 2 glycosyl transferase n=1 Tax=Candidatus Nitrosoglobus terrae TaxID=1630141 RepID=A0A1Q2SKA5_9GAMM|nr:glycosyltransferase family 2 protein [Candidatus Nitrosoglobus terrae]BAW79542.1 family 2 glycosyl transferase [Candidatus Nitrosoglobus terrae]